MDVSQSIVAGPSLWSAFLAAQLCLFAIAAIVFAAVLNLRAFGPHSREHSTVNVFLVLMLLAAFSLFWHPAQYTLIQMFAVDLGIAIIAIAAANIINLVRYGWPAV